MMTSSDAAFNPAETLETNHGLSVDERSGPGCYALELDTPGLDVFKDRWSNTYDVDPPTVLSEAITHGRPVHYAGAASDLTHRLEDHVHRDVRKAGVLAVLEPRDVWGVRVAESADAAFTLEESYAREVAGETGGVCWVNGSVLTR